MRLSAHHVNPAHELFFIADTDINLMYELTSAAAATQKFSVYPKSSIPSRLRYGNSTRVQSMVLVAKSVFGFSAPPPLA